MEKTLKLQLKMANLQTDCAWHAYCKNPSGETFAEYCDAVETERNAHKALNRFFEAEDVKDESGKISTPRAKAA